MFKRILAIILLFSLIGYSYLPISTTDISYGTIVNISVNASNALPNMDAYNLTCILPDSSSYLYSSVNNSNIWSSLVLINESGTWNCTSKAFNLTSYETNETVFLVACPSWKTINYDFICYERLNPVVDANTSYFDVGDNITLRVTLSSSSQANDVWLFSADNTTYQFIYSLPRNNWYVYYKVKQKQEVLSVQSFVNGTVDGVGDLVLTINPNPPSPSIFEGMFRELGFFVIVVLVVVLAIVVIIVVIKYTLSERGKW